LNAEEITVFEALEKKHDTLTELYATMDAYYRGAQRLEQLGLAIPPALRRFVVIVNWPRLVVDATTERLTVEGFRYPGTDDTDDELWRVFQANNLDEESALGHLDAAIFGRSYVCVGTNEKDRQTPIVTVESPQEMYASIDPRTRRVTAAIRRTFSTEPDPGVTPIQDLATLYLPNVTVWQQLQNGTWIETDRDEHKLGVVPVVPMVNKPRVGDPFGTSDMADVIPLTDAACRALTNLQVAQETHAVPQRYVLGATKGDFVDTEGAQLPAWEAYFGAIWGLANESAKVGQFESSSLNNFHETVNHYAKNVAMLTGLPPHYLGVTTDNPASADAIRSSEARLVKRCEDKQTSLSGAHEQSMRLVRRLQTGSWDAAAERLETVWRDPATPTKASIADAVTKLVGANIIPVEYAWEMLGFSATQRNRLKVLQADQAARAGLGDLTSLFGPKPTPAP
jgi:hypothetical protein